MRECDVVMITRCASDSLLEKRRERGGRTRGERGPRATETGQGGGTKRADRLAASSHAHPHARMHAHSQHAKGEMSSETRRPSLALALSSFKLR